MKNMFKATLSLYVLAAVGDAISETSYTLDDFQTDLFWKRPSQGK